MQKWEYIWLSVTVEKGTYVYLANGQRLTAATYSDALNSLGREGWELVCALSMRQTSLATESIPQFCLKRPIAN